jgi:hypothetical protein
LRLESNKWGNEEVVVGGDQEKCRSQETGILGDTREDL